MYKKIFILICVLFLASCKGTKQTVIKKPFPKPKIERKAVATPKKTQPKATEIIESTSKTEVTTDIVENYIQQYKEIAKNNMQTHGIPASITLAQGILESGSGQGRLAKQANNHFGIKCHSSWTGETIKHDDDKLQECFRKYTDASDSFRDHSLFLTSRSRYANLFKLPKDDYKSWAKGLRKAGYATDPKYPDKLITLIEKYNLQQYDNEVLGKTKDAQTDKDTNSTNPKNKTHKVVQGDTLYNISKRYDITVEELKKLNDLSDNTISIGQILKVK